MNAYRPNAGIVVFRKDGKVLLCQRIENFPQNWQFPQGGIDKGETPFEAAVRELREETSLVSVQFVCALPPLKYDFPADVIKKHPERCHKGQEQYWHLFFLTGNETEINLQTKEPEFKAYEWVFLPEAVSRVVDFKRDVYTQMAQAFNPKIKTYLSQL